MKWIVLLLLIAAGVFAAIGVWTRVVAHSPDEQAGADISFGVAGLLLVCDLLLLSAWAVATLFSA